MYIYTYHSEELVEPVYLFKDTRQRSLRGSCIGKSSSNRRVHKYYARCLPRTRSSPSKCKAVEEEEVKEN